MCDSTQGSLCPSPMTIHQCMWIQWSILQITTYIHILHTYYILHTTYYVQNEWSHSLLLHSVQARQKKKNKNKNKNKQAISEIKNNDGLHFCTTEIYVFRMCYMRHLLMFCCDHVVDDVRRWHMTSWKLEFIILPRPSFGARCPRQGLSPGLYLCWGSVLWI